MRTVSGDAKGHRGTCTIKRLCSLGEVAQETQLSHRTVYVKIKHKSPSHVNSIGKLDSHSLIFLPSSYNIFNTEIIPTGSSPCNKCVTFKTFFCLNMSYLIFHLTYHVGVLIIQFLTFPHTAYTPIISFTSHSIIIVRKLM